MAVIISQKIVLNLIGKKVVWKQISAIFKDDNDNEYDYGVILTMWLENCDDADLSNAETDNDSLTDLISVSNDYIPKIIEHDNDVKASYSNHNKIVP